MKREAIDSDYTGPLQFSASAEDINVFIFIFLKETDWNREKAVTS